MTQPSQKTALLRNRSEETPTQNEGALLTPDAHHYIQAATSDNTRKAYQADVRHFMNWGGSLPTTAEVVIRYLEQHADTLNPRTLVRRLTAIKQWHLYQGFSDPTSQPAIRKTLTGIKNIHGTPKEKAPPLTIESLIMMVKYLKHSDRLIDIRNCAMLQIGFFGAFRRSELVAIQWEAINFVPEGIEILIPRSKTDQAGDGQYCAIPYGDDILCPVTALITWRDRSQCQSGYVFRQFAPGAKLKEEGIKPRQVNIFLKSIANACHLPQAHAYSSHSMRRGFASEGSKKGVPFGSIMRQGRWRHEGTVLGYIDEGKRFDQNAAGMLLNHPENKE